MPKETYVVIGYDATDAAAPQRRLDARPDHLTAMQASKDAGIIKLAVALQNEAGTASIGSIVLLDVNSYDEVQAYLDGEPYVSRGVWETVKIHKGAVPPLFSL